MTAFDTAISRFFASFIGKYFLIDGIFVFFSEYLIYILSGVFLLYVVRIKDWKERARIFFLGILGLIISRGIITPLIRFFFNRQRPFVSAGIKSLIGQVGGNSFPSGHMTFIVPLMFVLLLINRKAGVWGLVGSVIIGIARVGAGVHWMTDIAGGFLVGYVSYIIAKMILKIETPAKTSDSSHKANIGKV